MTEPKVPLQERPNAPGKSVPNIADSPEAQMRAFMMESVIELIACIGQIADELVPVSLYYKKKGLKEEVFTEEELDEEEDHYAGTDTSAA